MIWEFHLHRKEKGIKCRLCPELSGMFFVKIKQSNEKNLKKYCQIIAFMDRLLYNGHGERLFFCMTRDII